MVDSVTTSTSFDRAAALSISGRFGLICLISLILAALLLVRVRFNFARIASFLATREWLFRTALPFSFHVRWLVPAFCCFVALPFVFLLMWGVVLAASVAPYVVGCIGEKDHARF